MWLDPPAFKENEACQYYMLMQSTQTIKETLTDKNNHLSNDLEQTSPSSIDNIYSAVNSIEPT